MERQGAIVHGEGNTIIPLQAVVDYAVEAGDSGGPVISGWGPYPDGNPVDTTLVGITWGGRGGAAVFSHILGVEYDLGLLNTCAPPKRC